MATSRAMVNRGRRVALVAHRDPVFVPAGAPIEYPVRPLMWRLYGVGNRIVDIEAAASRLIATVAGGVSNFARE